MAQSRQMKLALAERLSPDASRLLQQVAESAQSPVYVVGGIVRDLLLGRPSLDLDVVVEGDAIALAKTLSSRTGGTLRTYPAFGTATLHLGSLNVDLAGARAERYPQPGALPVVRRGSLRDDLKRRDFTINAMALSLNPTDFGALVDPLGGMADLEAKLIRIIHPSSFVDDATRMLRAVRYEARFHFRLEHNTETLLRRDSRMLSTISGERIRYEFERIFAEESPEPALARAGNLGLLSSIHPGLQWDDWVSTRFQRAHNLRIASPPVYAALLLLRLDDDQASEVARRLSFPGEWARTAKEAKELAKVLPALEAPGLAASAIYEMLAPYGRLAIKACLAAAADSPTAASRLARFLETLADTKPLLNGREIIALGVPPGPLVGAVVAELRRARLDGATATRDDEIALVSRWLRGREDRTQA